MADIYRAKEPFAFTGKDGVPKVVQAGSLMSGDDPDYAGKEHLFERVEVSVARASRVKRSAGVEDATAEPGAKRSLSEPTKHDDDADDDKPAAPKRRGPGRPRKTEAKESDEKSTPTESKPEGSDDGS